MVAIAQRPCLPVLSPMAGCVIEGLYGLTPDGLPREVLLERVAAALAGGMRLLQYRAKQEARATRQATAAQLLELCRRHGACLIVNDDPDLAVRVGADGVHLGRDDAHVREARRLMGSRAVIGVSCYADLERAVRLRAEGADYVAFGSFFASSVKPGAVRAPVELLAAARARLDCPTVAIGGITLENARMLLDAGASALAVITDLFAHPDVRGRAEGYTHLLAHRAAAAGPG